LCCHLFLVLIESLLKAALTFFFQAIKPVRYDRQVVDPQQAIECALTRKSQEPENEHQSHHHDYA
jgi:hypothetical protein